MSETFVQPASAMANSNSSRSICRTFSTPCWPSHASPNTTGLPICASEKQSEKELEGRDSRLESYSHAVKFFTGEGGIWIRVTHENARCAESERLEYVGPATHASVQKHG